MGSRSVNRMRPDDDFLEYFERGAKAIEAGWPYDVILTELREIVRKRITPPIARKGGVAFNIKCFDKVTHLGIDFYEYLNNRIIKSAEE